MTFVMLVAGCLTSCEPDKAEVVVGRDNRFTGRGNDCETLLSLTVAPQSDCVLKGVECRLQASAADVTSLCLCLDDEVIGRVEVEEGKTDYVISCRQVMTDTTVCRLAADISMEATEGRWVSADITSVRFRGSSVVPETPERKTICAGPSQYSSITVLPDGSIGAYIEENRRGVELWYENFSLQWLRTH